MSDWVRFELGPPTLGGALGGAPAFAIGLVLGAALGAVGLRPGTGVS